jgi:primary-amine oxidase
MLTPWIRRGLCALLLLTVGLSPDAARLEEPKGEEPPPGPKDGTLVQWEGWSFRWAVRKREGLVLHQVSYHGKSVLKYAGLVEIFVPYNRGSPRPEDSREGMGNRLVELLPGKDCIPGSVCQVFDVNGKTDGKRVVMMHEEPTGLVYMGKHGRAYGKMLVLWAMSRMAGYTYVLRWRFRDDGCLMPEVGLTGELDYLGRGDSTPFGSLVGKDARGEKVFAPSHVHNFYFCLDLDIDGKDNHVEEFNYTPEKPGGTTATHSWTPLLKETSRPAKAESFRSWRVLNRNSKNALGHPRSYELMPGGNGTYRGGASESFAQAEVWATKFDPKQFPSSSVDPRSLKTALPSYLNDESLDGVDIVLWYALHVHHIPHSEQYPAMPVEWVSFQLVPRDFLDASPLQPK